MLYACIRYFGVTGDDVKVFDTEEGAEHCAMEYVREGSDYAAYNDVPEFESYEAMREWWEGDDGPGYGSFDDRWELRDVTIEGDRGATAILKLAEAAQRHDDGSMTPWLADLARIHGVVLPWEEPEPGDGEGA